MKNLFIPIVVAVLFASCKKEIATHQQIEKVKKAHNQASIASQFHYYAIHDSIVTVDGVQRLAFVAQLTTPFPDGSTVWSMQLNHSMTDTSTAVPAQFSPFLFGYPGAGMYTNGSLNFDPNYFWVYDQNSFPGQGIATYWFVGENFTGSGPFNADAIWYTTGSAFDQLTWNTDGSITH